MTNRSPFLLLLLFVVSCNTPIHHLFNNKTPHEEFAAHLEDTNLDETPDGKAWLSASKTALESPQTVLLPLNLQGYFQPDKSRALGLLFTAQQGERISFSLTKKERFGLSLYADLYQQINGETSHLLSADTSSNEITFDVSETGTFILRLQPPLHQTGSYSLSASIKPSLGFPVSGGKAQAGSFWGDDRDGGKRRHEGVDIFAPKLTPALAATDGEIVSVREGGLGGKTVWLKPTDKKFTLYYAHLDQQLVQEGQAVKQGDVVGLVGNTGNAVHTPSHLHFGVYGPGGAVDPFPFINQTVKKAPATSNKDLTTYLRLLKDYKSPNGRLIMKNTLLVPLALTGKGYIAELPDGAVLQLPFAAVQNTKEIIKPSLPGTIATVSTTGFNKS